MKAPSPQACRAADVIGQRTHELYSYFLEHECGAHYRAWKLDGVSIPSTIQRLCMEKARSVAIYELLIEKFTRIVETMP